MASLLDLAQARLGGLLAPQQRPSMVGLLGGQRPQGTLASTIAGYTPPQMQAMSNQQVMDYARTVAQTAQQNLQTQMSDLDKALVMGQQGIQVGDREALARLMEQVPGLMGATAYHGTPHTIRGKFDISKVGTGEGAQSYGHGMYFAENPAVAKEYQKRLSADSALNYQARGLDSAYISAANSFKEYGSNYDETLKGLKEAYKNASEKDLELAAKVAFQPTGNLYKVDIPDEYIPNMLDWDKPLKEQTPQVQEALAKINPKFYDPKSPNYDPNESGKWIYMSVAGNITPKAQQAASAQLNELGIKGIRYLDEGSRGAGKGTSNFVVFDPSDVKILEKNSQKVEGLLD